MTTFGLKLRKLRQRHRTTQAILADALKLSSSTISAWERGREFPEKYDLEHLAGYFEMTVDNLVDGTNYPTAAASNDYVQQSSEALKTMTATEMLAHLSPDGRTLVENIVRDIFHYEVERGTIK